MIPNIINFLMGFLVATFQSLPFCSTIVKHIFEKASSQVLMKLPLCCKEFQTKNENVIPCYKLALESPLHERNASGFSLRNTYNHIDITENSVRICDNNSSKLFPKKQLAISQRLFVHSENDGKLLSKFIPEIYSCEAKYLELQFQHLTFKEYQFLTEKAMVLELILKNCKIVDEDEADVLLEDLLKMVLNVQFLEIGKPALTPNSAQIMSQLPFKNKFQRFYLWKLSRIPQPQAFCKFMNKNFMNNCKVKIDIQIPNSNTNFITDDRNDFLRIVRQVLYEKLNVFDAVDWYGYGSPEKYECYEEDPMWANCSSKHPIHN